MMGLIQHSINWCKREIFEGKMSLLFGVIVLMISLAYWKFGSTPYAKAMVIPILAVAVFSMSVGIYLITTNQARIPAYTAAYTANQEQFIQNEKARTEAFIKWYPYTRYIFLGVMLVAVLTMVLSNGSLARAIGIALMLLSLYVFVLDHFSEERAHIYYGQIVKANNPEPQ